VIKTHLDSTTRTASDAIRDVAKIFQLSDKLWDIGLPFRLSSLAQELASSADPQAHHDAREAIFSLSAAYESADEDLQIVAKMGRWLPSRGSTFRGHIPESIADKVGLLALGKPSAQNPVNQRGYPPHVLEAKYRRLRAAILKQLEALRPLLESATISVAGALKKTQAAQLSGVSRLPKETLEAIESMIGSLRALKMELKGVTWLFGNAPLKIDLDEDEIKSRSELDFTFLEWKLKAFQAALGKLNALVEESGGDPTLRM
jgi:hypothetical protein